MYFKVVDFDDGALATVPDAHPPASRQDARWHEMVSYLDAKAAYAEALAERQSNRLTFKQAIEMKPGFLWLSAMAFGLMWLLPFAYWCLAEHNFLAGLFWACVLFLPVVPLLGILYHEIDSDDEKAAAFAAVEKPEAHDDGDNDLAEVRMICESVSNLERAMREADEDAAQAARISAIRDFISCVKGYVLLSFWDGGERRLEKGFAEAVMRMSSAWKAYAALIASEEYAGYAEVADAQIDDVVASAQKCAYRNFARVDARVHGEDHIFDLPDAPRALTDAERLAIAAAVARDAE